MYSQVTVMIKPLEGVYRRSLAGAIKRRGFEWFEYAPVADDPLFPLINYFCTEDSPSPPYGQVKLKSDWNRAISYVERTSGKNFRRFKIWPWKKGVMLTRQGADRSVHFHEFYHVRDLSVAEQEVDSLDWQARGVYEMLTSVRAVSILPEADGEADYEWCDHNKLEILKTLVNPVKYLDPTRNMPAALKELKRNIECDGNAKAAAIAIADLSSPEEALKFFYKALDLVIFLESLNIPIGYEVTIPKD